MGNAWGEPAARGWCPRCGSRLHHAGPAFIEDGYRMGRADGHTRAHVKVCGECRALVVGGLDP